MKRKFGNLAILIVCLSQFTIASFAQESANTQGSKYVFSCESTKAIFRLQRRLSYINAGNLNGWQKYYGKLDYALRLAQPINGTIDVQVLARDDRRPGYRTTIISLLSSGDAGMLKAGYELSRVGFASITFDVIISSSFSGRWSSHGRAPAEFDKLNFANDELKCWDGH